MMPTARPPGARRPVRGTATRLETITRRVKILPPRFTLSMLQDEINRRLQLEKAKRFAKELHRDSKRFGNLLPPFRDRS